MFIKYHFYNPVVIIKMKRKTIQKNLKNISKNIRIYRLIELPLFHFILNANDDKILI
jgi:hypothetical protein